MVKKSADEVEAELDALKDKYTQLMNVNAKLKSENELLNIKIETRNIEIKALSDARNILKNDNDFMQDKMYSLEQELYE